MIHSIFRTILKEKYCVRSIHIRSSSGPYFSAFRVNTEKNSVPLRIQSECEKIRTRKTPNTDTFHAVKCFYILLAFVISNIVGNVF